LEPTSGGNWQAMNDPNGAATTPGGRPPMPSITASVLIETRQLIQAVAAWLTRG
jgi:hypothetical protein